MRPGAWALLAAAAVLATAAPARAQAPVLRELRDGAGEPTRQLLPGAVAILAGEHLHACPPPRADSEGRLRWDRCDHDELRVTLEGERLFVFPPCTSTEVFVQLPADASLGAATIVLEIAGRGRATLAFELLHQKEWQRAKAARGSTNPFVASAERLRAGLRQIAERARAWLLPR